MLAKAKAGMYDGYLLEGMACPGGCMGGAGVLADVRKATMGLEQQKKTSTFEKPSRSDYLKYLHLITKEVSTTMKMKTKTITVTAIMIALCVVVQLLKPPVLYLLPEA